MTKLNQNQIRELARKIIRQSPGGIRYAELVARVFAENPETPRNTINGSVWDLATKYPEEISKPTRGLFVPAIPVSDVKVVPSVDTKKTSDGPQEQEFYASFAEFLQKDLDEATVAVELGGAGLRAKWGTPDVVGVYKPRASQMIKFTPEVISAEIKVDPRSTIEAFGQAIAYRLFSAKSYVVMPSTISEEEEGRLDALCTLFGIGIVLFDLDPKSPGFSIRAK